MTGSSIQNNGNIGGTFTSQLVVKEGRSKVLSALGFTAKVIIGAVVVSALATLALAVALLAAYSLGIAALFNPLLPIGLAALIGWSAVGSIATAHPILFTIAKVAVIGFALYDVIAERQENRVVILENKF